MTVRVLVATVMSTLATAPGAAAALHGPIYPMPGHANSGHGGNTCAMPVPTEAVPQTPGSVQGTTWTFGGGGAADSNLQTCPASNATPPEFDTERFEKAFWGMNPAARPRAAMDGAYDSSGETLTFRQQLSNLAQGALVWEGTSEMQACQPDTPPGCATFSTLNVDTRLTMIVTNPQGGARVPLLTPAQAGITNANNAEIGGVVQITPALRRFRVNVKITARFSSPAGQAFEDAEPFFNAWHHPDGNPFISSYTGAFWYENRAPILDFTYTGPAANSAVSFTATRYIDPDGAITSGGWDFTRDNVFEEVFAETPRTAQWTFARGEWPVSLVAVDNERTPQYPNGRATVLTKTVPVPEPSATPTPQPTVAPPADADGDGFPAALDCNDRNPAVRPGAFDVPGNALDEDCAGGPQPPLTMSPSPRITYQYKATASGTRFSSLAIHDVPSGSEIRASCKGKRCPKALTLRNQRGVVRLKTYARRKLAVKNVIEIRITKPMYTGIVKTLTIRRSKAPAVTTRCLAPGAATPTRCA